MPRFNGLVMRLGAICLTGLIALQITFVSIMIWPNGQPGMIRLVPPRDAAALVRAVEATPPSGRPVLLDALNTSRQIVEILPGFPDGAVRPPTSRREQALNATFSLYDAPLEGRQYQVQTRAGRAWTSILRGRIGAPGSLRLLVELRGGEVLAIERAPVVLQTLFARLSAILAAVSLVVIGMITLCYLQIARPINRLARTTAALAPDGQGPDIPLQGADEIRRLVRCLNEMRGRIRELVDARTRELAAIAHDLRTYLTRLRLRAEFIEAGPERDAAIRDLDEMSLLLDDTLLFAAQVHRAADAERDTVDVGEEVRALVALRAEAEQPVSTEEPSQDDMLALCPPLTLRRILANLVDNAIRYGGCARVRIEADLDWVRIVVEDDGPGVPETLIAGLTEPFRRLEPSRGRETGGAGLGLTIVKALAESHGGRLELVAGSPRGLRATVSLRRSSP